MYNLFRKPTRIVEFFDYKFCDCLEIRREVTIMVVVANNKIRTEGVYGFVNRLFAVRPVRDTYNFRGSGTDFKTKRSIKRIYG
ncbi:hypothetical protein LEP1GSC179_2883 [Leptospira santarosai str. MOR084]|uniref:Uncharacterized protein n=1 Tax=Leptospira santarosai str. MOR084 TaxID=1049984 RepID=A0A0E2BEX9_9LEPT|nr:hypothetical protein LEP1GSC179_2883 [Leptospira santarosai str. MOR084]